MLQTFDGDFKCMRCALIEPFDELARKIEGGRMTATREDRRWHTVRFPETVATTKHNARIMVW
jgi:hypothetical protein